MVKVFKFDLACTLTSDLEFDLACTLTSNLKDLACTLASDLEEDDRKKFLRQS